MKTNDVEMQTFVREGLERYYFDAKESVTAFETSLKNQLTELIQAMPGFSTFPAKGRQLGKPGIWMDGETMSVYARLVANDEACLELGMRRHCSVASPSCMRPGLTGNPAHFG